MHEEAGNGSPPQPRQFRTVGCGARGAGCVTRLAGFGMALGGANHIRTPVLFGESWAEGIGTGILMIAIGVVAVFAGARMSRFGRRHTARLIKDPSLLEPRSYILYLRPFDLDDRLHEVKPAAARNPLRRMWTPLSRTFEEDMVLSLRWKLRSRVVAVGRPGERLPLSGARRFYLPLDGWKPTVGALIREARLVVLATGTSEGTLWEFTEAVRLLPPERLLVAVFTDAADYDRFRRAAQVHFAARAAESEGREAARLAGMRWPDYPPLKKPDALTSRVVGLQGLIAFGPAWEPEFVRLDPTAVRALSDLGRLHKIMRQQVNPVIRRVRSRLSEDSGAANGSVIPPTRPSRSASRDTDTPARGPE
ncbi:hypothetical protein ACIBAI_01025 [Streptomyces sp. NPDC051041]|uniref:hypothetical protein n=1 Tax=Streptomyces sp. NPDC051041 TaxID=3365640 RepID=UPI003796D990